MECEYCDFSILIPVYNVDDRSLHRLVRDIKKSFHKKPVTYEIILIDDGSTANINYELFSEYKEVYILKHESNKSLFQVRLTGIKNAHGKYLLSVDADDSIYSMDWINIKNKFVLNSIDVLIFKLESGVTKYLPKQNRVNIPIGTYRDEKVFDCFTSNVAWNFVGKIFRTEVLRELINTWSSEKPYYINIAEDFCLTVCYFSVARVCVVDPTMGIYFYLQHPGSLTNNGWTQNREKIRAYLVQYSAVLHLIRVFFADRFSESSLEKNIKYNQLIRLYKILFRGVFSNISWLVNEEKEFKDLVSHAFPKEVFLEADLYAGGGR